MTKATYGWNDYFILYFSVHTPSEREIRAGTQAKKEPGDRSCRGHREELLISVLLVAYTEPRTNNTGTVSPSMSLACPHQSLIWKMSFRFSHSLNIRRHFLNWGLDDSNLWQVYIKASQYNDNNNQCFYSY